MMRWYDMFPVLDGVTLLTTRQETRYFSILQRSGGMGSPELDKVCSGLSILPHGSRLQDYLRVSQIRRKISRALQGKVPEFGR